MAKKSNPTSNEQKLLVTEVIDLAKNQTNQTEKSKFDRPAIGSYKFIPQQLEVLNSVFQQTLKRPLFIVGAGISILQGAPTMSTITQYLVNRLHSANFSSSDNTQNTIISEIKRLSLLLNSSVTRPLVAKLFGELQDSRISACEAAWTDFCEAFVAGMLQDGEAKPIWELEPSAAHNGIAQLYKDANALCVSFNFDGLTFQALANQCDTHHSTYKAFILDSASKIKDFFGRDNSVVHEWPVIKIRGDVFFAICRTSGCPSSQKWIPVYELKRLIPDSASPKQRVKKILQCPECSTERTLRISFPGAEKKEQETDEILRELWRYVVPTLSGIFVLGFSGIWDEYAVDFLFQVAKLLQIPIFDVKPRTSVSDDKLFLERFGRQYYPSVAFHPIDAYAESFMPALCNYVAEIKSSRVLTPYRFTNEGKLPADCVWCEGEHAQELRVTFSSGPNTSTNTIVVPHSGHTLPYQLPHYQELLSLENRSMLGLKNFWWGQESFSQHNRYVHSIGAARVAYVWHQRLLNNSPIRPVKQSDDDRAREVDFLLASVLVHDIGHLPFSHLFEEIFTELHWTSHHGVAFSHARAGNEKISDLFKHPELRQSLVESGYSEDELIALVHGCSGNPYLDAIVNSPIDADKIDYIFRDTKELGLGVNLINRDVWLNEFVEDQEISPEGLIRLNKKAALRVLELLETRMRLYADFYLSAPIRFLEAAAKKIITRVVLLLSSKHLVDKFRAEKGISFDPDLGKVKIAAVTAAVDGIYKKVKQERTKELGRNQSQEWPLLQEFYKMLTEGSFAEYIDHNYKLYLTQIFDGILAQFDPTISEMAKSADNGRLLRKLYKDFHLAGPFIVNKQHEEALIEIVREMDATFPDKVLFAIAKSPRFLSTSEYRRYQAQRPPIVGDNILVPSEDPSKWTMKDSAKVPLHLCNFSHFEAQYVSVLLMDPWQEKRLGGKYVLDVFRRKCKAQGIDLRD